MDTRENVITWFTREFGFSRNAATVLHHVQVLKDAQALSKLDDDDAVASVLLDCNQSSVPETGT